MKFRKSIQIGTIGNDPEEMSARIFRHAVDDHAMEETAIVLEKAAKLLRRHIVQPKERESLYVK